MRLFFLRNREGRQSLVEAYVMNMTGALTRGLFECRQGLGEAVREHVAV